MLCVHSGVVAGGRTQGFLVYEPISWDHPLLVEVFGQEDGVLVRLCGYLMYLGAQDLADQIADGVKPLCALGGVQHGLAGGFDCV